MPTTKRRQQKMLDLCAACSERSGHKEVCNNCGRQFHVTGPCMSRQWIWTSRTGVMPFNKYDDWKVSSEYEGTGHYICAECAAEMAE